MTEPDDARSEQMKYTLLGEDRTTEEEKLDKFTGQVNWSYLKPHYKSGVLFFVDSSLTLQRVGAAISADEKERVEGWMKTGDLVKIADLHARQWEGGDTEFEALVVSPFVLCRPVN